MNITNAQAAMIAGTYNCEIQCNIGYVMSQETKVDSIVSTCNFNWETWSVKSVQCERKYSNSNRFLDSHYYYNDCSKDSIQPKKLFKSDDLW